MAEPKIVTVVGMPVSIVSQADGTNRFFAFQDTTGRQWFDRANAALLRDALTAALEGEG